MRGLAVGVAVLLLVACTPDPSAPPATSPPASTASPSEEDLGAGLVPWLAAGPHPTVSAEYQLEDLRLPELPEPVEVAGTAIGPTDVSAPPLVMLLHGYTASCFSADKVTTDWPCPAGLEPVPSAEGFGYLQQRLASHGFLAVSVRANGVTVQATDVGQDAGAAARSALLRRHLEAWSAGEVSANLPEPNLPEPDLQSVLLVGHSRGGEGVDRAVADSTARDPWRVRGEVLIGPTGFEPAGRTRAPLVAMVGYCDGDVGPAPAQRYVDRAAAQDLLRTSILLPGANHNFFNAEWVPGEGTVPGGYDDAYGEGGDVDPTCDPEGSGRMSPDQQQQAAAQLLSVAAAGLLAGDPAALAALDGRIPIDLGEATPWLSAVGNGRTTLRLGAGYDASAVGAVTAQPCRGVSESEDPADCGAFLGEGTAVHWPGAYRGVAGEDAVRVTWDKPDGEVRLDLDEALDLSGADALELRVAVLAEGAPVALDISVADSSGATAPGASVRLEALPSGPLLPARLWGQQVAVADLAGADSVTRISLSPRSPSGTVWVLDVSARPRGHGGT